MVLVLGGCIHNLGYLNGVALQPEPVLGPVIARATASAIWAQNKGGPQTTPSSEILHKMTLNLLSLISNLLYLISYLLSRTLLYFKMAFIHKKITNGGYRFYIHTFKVTVPPTFLLQQFSAISIFRHVVWP